MHRGADSGHWAGAKRPVAAVAATGEALNLGVAACRRRLQRVRGSDDDGEADATINTPTRQLDFNGTATGSRGATETSPAAMSTVEEFMDTSLGGPAPEAPREDAPPAESEEPTTQEVTAAVPASEKVMRGKAVLCAGTLAWALPPAADAGSGTDGTSPSPTAPPPAAGPPRRTGGPKTVP